MDGHLLGHRFQGDEGKQGEKKRSSEVCVEKNQTTIFRKNF